MAGPAGVVMSVMVRKIMIGGTQEILFGVTRDHVKQIYDFRTGSVKPECLHEGWQTSGSVKIIRMAFNLYCNGTPSIYNIVYE